MEECYYRPPSEAYSLLIRVVRNCNWNRCKFCFMYKDMEFSKRTLEEIKNDIDEYKKVYNKIKLLSFEQGLGLNVNPIAMRFNIPWIIDGGPFTAFLGDSNAIVNKTDILVGSIEYLKENFSDIKRITTYARSRNLAKKKLEDLIRLKEAGLTRVHVGLETGDSELLKYIDKGASAENHIEGGRKVKEAGLSLSEYVILGLGGENYYHNHAVETASVLNKINPDFIRIRTLFIDENSGLYNDLQSGYFVPYTIESILKEELLLLENLNVTSDFVSDHVTNHLNLEGNLGEPGVKERMMEIIRELLSLPKDELRIRLQKAAISHL